MASTTLVFLVVALGVCNGWLFNKPGEMHLHLNSICRVLIHWGLFNFVIEKVL
jgi:uncharacterized membrane-anchored protein